MDSHFPGTSSREVTDAKGQTTQAREKLLQLMDTYLLRLLGREVRREGAGGRIGEHEERVKSRGRRKEGGLGSMKRE